MGFHGESESPWVSWSCPPRTCLALAVDGLTHLDEERSLFGAEFDVRLVHEDAPSSFLVQTALNPQPVLSKLGIGRHLDTASKWSVK